MAEGQPAVDSHVEKIDAESANEDTKSETNAIGQGDSVVTAKADHEDKKLEGAVSTNPDVGVINESNNKQVTEAKATESAHATDIKGKTGQICLQIDEQSVVEDHATSEATVGAAENVDKPVETQEDVIASILSTEKDETKVKEESTEAKPAAEMAPEVESKPAEEKVNTPPTEEGEQQSGGFNIQDKVTEIATSARDAITDGERVAEETVTVVTQVAEEKAIEVLDTFEKLASDASLHIQQYEQKAEDTVAEINQFGDEKMEETSKWLDEKSAELTVKTTELVETAHDTIVTGASAITISLDDHKEVLDGVSSTVSSIVEDIAATVHTEANVAADNLFTQLDEIKSTAVTVAKGAVARVRGDTSSLANGSAQIADSTSTETADNPSASSSATTEQTNATPRKSENPLVAVRNFFKKLFSSNSRQQASATKPATTTSTTSAKATETPVPATNGAVESSQS